MPAALSEQHAAQLAPSDRGTRNPAARCRSSPRRAHHRRPRHPSLPSFHARWLCRARCRSRETSSQAESNRRNQSRPHSSPTRTESRPSLFHHDRRTDSARRGRGRDGRIHIAARRLCRNIKSVASGENIVAQGAEAKRGSPLLDRGTRLNEADIALAASVGKSQLKVFVRPRVAVLTTGDEIVDVDAEPSPTQIRNSNTYSLAVQIQKAGGEPVLLPIAPDEPRRLRQLIEEGLQSDLLIMTGGVSMGRYDLVEQVLAELQAEFFFTGAKIQPGKASSIRPSRQCGAGALAREGASAPASYKYFFGLPGNPVSTMVTFELFARPMLEALAGMPPRPLHFPACPSEIRDPHQDRTDPIPSRNSFRQLCGRRTSELVPWQGSGDIAARSRANCYIVIPPIASTSAPANG